MRLWEELSGKRNILTSNKSFYLISQSIFVTLEFSIAAIHIFITTHCSDSIKLYKSVKFE